MAKINISLMSWSFSFAAHRRKLEAWPMCLFSEKPRTSGPLWPRCWHLTSPLDSALTAACCTVLHICSTLTHRSSNCSTASSHRRPDIHSQSKATSVFRWYVFQLSFWKAVLCDTGAVEVAVMTCAHTHTHTLCGAFLPRKSDALVRHACSSTLSAPGGPGILQALFLALFGSSAMCINQH